jgi:hypothetical protein
MINREEDLALLFCKEQKIFVHPWSDFFGSSAPRALLISSSKLIGELQWGYREASDHRLLKPYGNCSLRYKNEASNPRNF